MTIDPGADGRAIADALVGTLGGVGIRDLERDPVPGTERDAPHGPATFDFLTGELLTEG